MYYKRVAIKWLLSNHLEKELNPAEIMGVLPLMSGTDQNGQEKTQKWPLAMTAVSKPGEGLEVAVPLASDSSGAQPVGASHQYNAVWALIEMCWHNRK